VKKVKLTQRYNSLLLPVIVLLFAVSITGSFFLIKKTLQNELDGVLLRSRGRMESFVKQNNQLPTVSIFNDQEVSFEKENILSKDTGFTSATQFIAEQGKNHISRRLSFNLSVKDQLYKISISQPLEGTRHLTILITIIALVTIVLTFLIFFLVNRYMLRGIWHPFFESLDAMKAFRIDDQSKLAFPSSSIQEFQLMVEHFETVTMNARREYRSLKEFSENASHEIQTPLSIIRSNLELLLQEPLTEAQCEALQFINAAVGKLSKVQQALLLLTKIENKQFQQTVEIDVEEELKNKLLEFEELWNVRQISFSSELHPSRIFANKDLFDVLLNNLFSNATRHNVPNGSIHVFARSNQIEISNTGNNGALDQDKVFKRFYKSTVNGNNNGLGLSIVKEICVASGITINYSYSKKSHRFLLEWQNGQ
jgi:signal transduction histidine kinase